MCSAPAGRRHRSIVVARTSPRQLLEPQCQPPGRGRGMRRQSGSAQRTRSLKAPELGSGSSMACGGGSDWASEHCPHSNQVVLRAYRIDRQPIAPDASAAAHSSRSSTRRNADQYPCAHRPQSGVANCQLFWLANRCGFRGCSYRRGNCRRAAQRLGSHGEMSGCQKGDREARECRAINATSPGVAFSHCNQELPDTPGSAVAPKHARRGRIVSDATTRHRRPKLRRSVPPCRGLLELPWPSPNAVP